MVAQNELVCRLISQHWNRAAPGESPDGYCYVVPDDPSDPAGPESPNDSETAASPASNAIPALAICPANGRAIIREPAEYTVINRLCDALVIALAGRRERPGKSAARTAHDLWCALPATIVEYQGNDGTIRSVALMCSAQWHATAHGYALAIAKPDNGFVCDSLACIQIESGTATAGKARFWWPASLARLFAHLVPHFATATWQLPLAAELHPIIREFRNASDLRRAIEDGTVPFELAERLADVWNTHPTIHALIEPATLLGPDKCLDRTVLTDFVVCRTDLRSPVVLDRTNAESVAAMLHADPAESAGERSFTPPGALEQQVTRLLGSRRLRAAVLNLRLPAIQTQFCLRHFLEGRSDRIRLLTPAEWNDPAIEQSMRLSRPGGDTDQPKWFMHGPRRVHLVAFEKSGQIVECAAFDPAVPGFAQVRSVWPGQVADFFSRNSILLARELFNHG